MKASKLQHRVTRARVKVRKLLEFRRLERPLWIRRVLVDPNRSPAARAQEGQFRGSSPGQVSSVPIVQLGSSGVPVRGKRAARHTGDTPKASPVHLDCKQLTLPRHHPVRPRAEPGKDNGLPVR